MLIWQLETIILKKIHNHSHGCFSLDIQNRKNGASRFLNMRTLGASLFSLRYIKILTNMQIFFLNFGADSLDSGSDLDNLGINP